MHLSIYALHSFYVYVCVILATKRQIRFEHLKYFECGLQTTIANKTGLNIYEHDNTSNVVQGLT